MKSSQNESCCNMECRVERSLANQVETQHLLSDIEKTCIEAQYDEHIAAYAAGMNEMKIAALGNPDHV